MSKSLSLVAIFLLLIFNTFVLGFEKDEVVPVSMNKVWPHSNPSETYEYYSKLPVCQPPAIQKQSMTFGQIMRGDRLVNSLYKINFDADHPREAICSRSMSLNDINALKAAIDEGFMFEMYVADLPVYSFVGVKSMETRKSFEDYRLATTFDFVLGKNNGQVVSASLFTDQGMANITNWHVGMSVEFNYSVRWVESEIPVEARLQKQLTGVLTTSSSALDIHWLAIINSFVLVLLGVSLIAGIMMRVVRSDLAKYLRIPDEELAAGAEEESGWKLLHADVFRPPPHRMWFCALIGSGAHLFFVVVCIVLIGAVTPYLERGALLTSGIFGYLLTSFIAGYISSNLYGRLGGVKWAWNIIITTVMFMGPAFVVWGMLNLVAIVYSSTAALPFLTAFVIFMCWIFVTVPLTVMGGIFGRRRAERLLKTGKAFPYKTTRLAREIPRVRMFQNPNLQMLLAGFLPFSAIYIELHYIFMSVWGSKYVYTMYGVLFLAFVMLLMVAATVAILLTYFHLNAEDHRWWWRSFMTGGSVSIYFFFHCAYFFLIRSSRMYGVLQVTFFFGYSLLVAWGVALILGFVTFFATYGFIHYIYSNVKVD
eukprot:GHVN01005750.1.p1 GENE.GHVN01005750.1~~GHVN01005750.1.p1  ORF type:complete len:601 (-),score=59.76 GHVN01005750.1:139-1920(-)